MKKISIIVLSLSAVLLLAGCDSKTTTPVDKEASTMDHSKMSQTTTTSDVKHAYHYEAVSEDIKAVVFSQKPLVSGNNVLYVKLTQNKKPLTGAKAKIKFFMPEMPGMPYMEYKTKGELSGDKYKFNINLGMNGTWQYQLKFKTSDDKVHTVKGSLNI